VSIESGIPEAASAAAAAAFMRATLSMPGMPPLTSMTAAPASAWRRASSLTGVQFPAIMASFRGPFREGLILSPTTRSGWPGPQRETRVRLARTVSRGDVPVLGLRPDKRWLRALTCAGVVPQHPPMTVAPASASFAQASAKGSGPSQSPSEGSPPLGYTNIGSPSASRRRRTVST